MNSVELKSTRLTRDDFTLTASNASIPTIIASYEVPEDKMVFLPENDPIMLMLCRELSFNGNSSAVDFDTGNAIADASAYLTPDSQIAWAEVSGVKVALDGTTPITYATGSVKLASAPTTGTDNVSISVLSGVVGSWKMYIEAPEGVSVNRQMILEGEINILNIINQLSKKTQITLPKKYLLLPKFKLVLEVNSADVISWSKTYQSSAYTNSQPNALITIPAQIADVTMIKGKISEKDLREAVNISLA